MNDQYNTGDQPSDSCSAAVSPEVQALLAIVRDLTHTELISRDTEIGLRAEVLKLRIDLNDERSRIAYDRAQLELLRKQVSRELSEARSSVTWRAGRIIIAPAAQGKRVVRGLKRRLVAVRRAK